MRTYNICGWLFIVLALFAMVTGDLARGTANLGVALALRALDLIEQGQR